jgi:hypothetical protein
MASYTSRPTLDLAAGREVLDRQLPLALEERGVASLEKLGWSRPTPRRLLIPFKGVHGGVEDRYLLRLDFLTGPEWPPSAQFVNPDTLEYSGLADQHHLPRLHSTEVHVHPAYTYPHMEHPVQLICCSATFEYYDTLHGGQEAQLWREGDSFMVAVNAIGRAMAQHYSGRFERHAG